VDRDLGVCTVAIPELLEAYIRRLGWHIIARDSECAPDASFRVRLSDYWAKRLVRP
jgi:hypothetical protein